jgi:FkbM family methyltransferase
MTLPPSLESCRAKYGRFIFPKNDIYIGRSLAVYGQYCESEVTLFKQILRDGDIAVDAGGNIGAFSVPLCLSVGDKGVVYAFEPQPYLCSILSTNLINNGCGNARVMSTALGDAPGSITVPSFNYAAKDNFGGISFAEERKDLQEKSGALSIAQMRLDDVLDVPHLRLIKADVEGMELALLKGSMRLLETYTPYLYLECNKPEATDALIGLLEPFGYKFYWHISSLYDPKNWKGHVSDIFGNTSCVNMICAPKGAVVQNFMPATGPASHPRY